MGKRKTLHSIVDSNYHSYIIPCFEIDKLVTNKNIQWKPR